MLLYCLMYRDGFATRFAISDLPSTGRNSMGLLALSLSDGDEMADIDILTNSTISGNNLTH